VSDCGAIMDFHMHHKVTDTVEESAAMALKAGCDLNCGQAYQYLLTAYHEGKVSDTDLPRAAERVMASRIALGMLEGTSEYDGILMRMRQRRARLPRKEAALRSGAAEKRRRAAA
jgi:beta-glucosidase